MKTKFRSFSTILVLVFTLTIAGSANAQKRPPQPPPIPDSTQINDMIMHMTSDLGLSKEQADIIKTLHFEHFNKLKRLLEKGKGQMEANRQQHEKLRKEFDEQLEKQLTKEQFAKHQKKMEEMRSHEHGHR